MIKHKKKMLPWPANVKDLLMGQNDGWNNFQKANVGRQVSSDEWRTERAKIRLEFCRWKGIPCAENPPPEKGAPKANRKPKLLKSETKKERVKSENLEAKVRSDSPVLCDLKEILRLLPVGERKIELRYGGKFVATSILVDEDSKPIQDQKTMKRFDTPRQWAMYVLRVRKISVRKHLYVRGTCLKQRDKMLAKDFPIGQSIDASPTTYKRFPDLTEVCQQYR